jgi:hypothetical protein
LAKLQRYFLTGGWNFFALGSKSWNSQIEWVLLHLVESDATLTPLAHASYVEPLEVAVLLVDLVFNPHE